MRVLLLVEGESDRPSLRTLAQKVLGSHIGANALILGKGGLLSPEKVMHHASAAIKRQSDIGKVLLCIDSECTSVDETRGRIEAVARQVAKQLPGPSVRAIVVDHSLEGWLLQDRQALAEFLGMRPNTLKYPDPEEECRPAGLMGRVFRQAGRDFVKTGTLPALAEQVDPNRVAENSLTFREFRTALQEA